MVTVPNGASRCRRRSSGRVRLAHPNAAATGRDTLKEVARDKAAQEAIRRNTYTGRPLGTDSFLSKVEHLIGRRVRPLPIGRQKGWRKNKHEATTTQRKKQTQTKANKR